MTDVAIVHLGRSRARGEVRRVASWHAVFTEAGADVQDVAVARSRLPHPGAVADVVHGRATPETCAWSAPRLVANLRDLSPRVVLVVSARAYAPSLVSGPWITVLDFVDRLDHSYADRARIVRGILPRAAYRALATAHARTARRLAPPGLRTVAAGWRDAHELGADWVPVTVDAPDGSAPETTADHDVLFFGTLRYPPNQAALARLARIWPVVLASRPGTRALVAGADPPARVRALAADLGWTLISDFPSLPEVARRCRLAVAPLEHTAGIQIKVLDAAALGLPQVVTPAALVGLAPGFPLEPVAGDRALSEAVVRLLDDPTEAAAVASRAREAVLSDYSVERWAGWARALL